MTNLEKVKDKFYEKLHSIIATVGKAEKAVISNFKARVGSDNIFWDGVIRK